MNRLTLVNVNLRLCAPSLGFYVDVRLRNFHGRWLAIADIAGEPEVGLGHTGVEAIAASLSSLGSVATVALMSDSQLSAQGQHAPR